MYCGLWQSNVYSVATDFNCSVIVHDHTVTVVLANNFCDTDLMHTDQKKDMKYAHLSCFRKLSTFVLLNEIPLSPIELCFCSLLTSQKNVNL